MISILSIAISNVILVISTAAPGSIEKAQQEAKGVAFIYCGNYLLLYLLSIT